MTSLTNAVGLLAGICTTFAFIPQVAKTWRTRRADDISIGWLIIFSGGTFLWLIYGLWLREVPIVAANGATLLLVLVILYVKLRSRRDRAMPGE
jgi:MtN3 and saliva related transmembrane protein